MHTFGKPELNYGNSIGNTAAPQIYANDDDDVEEDHTDNDDSQYKAH